MNNLLVALVLLLGLNGALMAQTIPAEWLTDYEKSGYKRTPRYAETMEYCRRLQKASPWISVTRFGVSPEGRELPLVIASKDRIFDPQRAAQSGKGILLIQNGIHSGEIDGKDACLMLLRDIAITRTKASLLDNLIVLIIPIFNVDGHERFGPYNRINQNGPEEMGWRVTAQNLNLNRDYMKADSPEMQAWLTLFNTWNPDFFIDCHVTNGADYQHVVTYAIEARDHMSPPIQTWINDRYMPLLAGLETNGVPLAPYIFLRDNIDPLKGVSGGTAPPRFSNIYVTLRNRPGLLIETHMLKDYKSRVEGTYHLLEATMQLLNTEFRSLRTAIQSADEMTRKGLVRPFPIDFETAQVPNKTIRYFGVKQRQEHSEISGGTRIVYTDDSFDAEVPWYDSVIVKKAIDPPVAYIIPQQWNLVMDRLRLHGVKTERLKAPTELEVELYRFSSAKWRERPYEGRHPVSYTVTKSTERRTYPAGTVVVRLNQSAAKVAIHALEPEAPDAFAAWGFFDAVFEEKEYAESYVMEEFAPEMLRLDPQLREEFESKLRADTAFANSASARLRFFYERSPYWDSQVNVYPVARLVQTVPLATEPHR